MMGCNRDVENIRVESVGSEKVERRERGNEAEGPSVGMRSRGGKVTSIASKRGDVSAEQRYE